jgi:hypothetical protein
LNQLPNEPDLPLCRLGEGGLASLPADLASHLAFRVIAEPGDWLNTTYQLLAEEFEPDVLDPLERYVGWLELNRTKKNRFPYLLVVAYCLVEGRALLLGVVSGNIMKVEEYEGPNTDENNDLYLFAIGHQVTDIALRKSGVRGVGTRLWKSAIQEANAWIKDLNGRFCYSVLEAEDESIGFWSKLGHLWPKDVHYWQPPLEFDETGQYKYPEVPETMMLGPMEAAFEKTIYKKFLQNIIATMYLNWSLDKYRDILTVGAMRKAQDYVMGYLFGRVCAEMPGTDPIPLVPSLPDKRP